MGAFDRIREAAATARSAVLAARDTFSTQVRGAYEARAASRKSGLKGRAIPDQSLWAQFQRVGGSLTPLQVSEIIREADTGYMWRLCDLANEVRQKDCHLQSVLATNEEGIAGLDWELVLPDRATKAERKAKDFTESSLRLNPGVVRVIAHQAGATYYGRAISEADYERDGKYLVPATFTQHSARRFGFDQTTGQLIWRDWNQPSVGIDFRNEWPDKFIVSQPRVTGDVPVREGLVRVLMWAALFRNWTLSDWLKLGEIAWKPWRTGTYSKKANATAEREDIDNLTAILEGMSASGVAVYPDTTKVDVKWAQGTAQKSMHPELFRVIGDEMSKCVLGQTETTQASPSSGYAQASVHNEIRKDLRVSRARSVAADLSRDLVEPMCRINFGSKIRASRFRFLTEDMADVLSFSQGLANLAGPSVKMKVSAVWARKQLGIPEPEKGDELLGSGGDVPGQLPLPGIAPPPTALAPVDETEPAQTDEAGAEDGGNGD